MVPIDKPVESIWSAEHIYAGCWRIISVSLFANWQTDVKLPFGWPTQQKKVQEKLTLLTISLFHLFL
jgi:hypothetical protein